ncbi:MAG TPA: DUF2914 domain-containing protein [Longimicrobiales bacterium]|nr:DUF2914 domain-containing protein [Longimicrobiales bacterium]
MLSKTRMLVLAGAALALLLVTAATPRAAAAQEETESGVTVSRAVLATGVEDREPVGEATSFSADVGRVYFYVVLEGDFAEQQFEAVWLRDGEEVARVPLTARGPRWRTWSAKTIPAEWAGAWTVRLVDGSGTELSAIDFTVGSG